MNLSSLDINTLASSIARQDEALLSVVLLGTTDPSAIADSLTSVLENCVGIRTFDVAVVLQGKAVAHANMFKQLDDSLRIITATPTQSVSDAWTLGVQQANSRWILLVTEDIRLQTGWLNPIYSFLSDHPDCTAITPSVATGTKNATTAAPDAGVGVCLMVNRAALNEDRIESTEYITASQVVSVGASTPVAPVTAAPAAFMSTAPTRVTAPGAAPVVPTMAAEFAPSTVPHTSEPAPGGGAPPGPVRFVGNSIYAGASFEDSKKRLNLGCGTNQIQGWLNVDGDAACSPNMVMDLRYPMTLADNSVELIYSEHFFEHFTLPQALVLMGECFRVLKPGGVMRTAMPNLRDTILFYLGNWKSQPWLRDYPEVTTAAQMVNLTLREWGHQYVYDVEDLTLRLEQTGFTNVQPMEHGQSPRADLCGLETRQESFLIVECTKA